MAFLILYWPSPWRECAEETKGIGIFGIHKAKIRRCIFERFSSVELGDCYEAALARGRFMLLFCGHGVRGALAGNGEEMAEAKQELKARKSSSNKQSSPNKQPKSRAGGKAKKNAGTKALPKVVEIPGGAEEECAEGAELLQTAANQAVVDSSLRIAFGLARKAEEGDSASAKLLVDFMVGKNLPKRKRMKRWRSRAR